MEACLHNLKKDFYLREFYAILCPDNYIYIRRIYNGAYQNIKYKKICRTQLKKVDVVSARLPASQHVKLPVL